MPDDDIQSPKEASKFQGRSEDEVDVDLNDSLATLTLSQLNLVDEEAQQGRDGEFSFNDRGITVLQGVGINWLSLSDHLHTLNLSGNRLESVGVSEVIEGVSSAARSCPSCLAYGISTSPRIAFTTLSREHSAHARHSKSWISATMKYVK